MTLQKVMYYTLECDDCSGDYADEDEDVLLLIEQARGDNWKISYHPNGTIQSVLCPKCARQAPHIAMEQASVTV